MHHLPYLPQHTQHDLPIIQKVNKITIKGTQNIILVCTKIWKVYFSSFYLQYLFPLFACQLLSSSLEPPATPKKLIKSNIVRCYLCYNILDKLWLIKNNNNFRRNLPLHTTIHPILRYSLPIELQGAYTQGFLWQTLYT